MLDLKNISCGYNGVDVIHDISFSVANGEKVCIIGRNGCGKSTLLKAIASVISYKGDIEIDGQNLRAFSRRKLSENIGLLGQISSVNFDYSVYDTVAMGRYIYSKKKLFSSQSKDENEIVEQILKEQNLLDIKEKSVCELSGGQLQRVLLSRVFAQKPNIILLDEPTNHLDLKCQIELLSNLNSWIKDTSKSVVAVLHDINLSVLFADKIVLMDKGKIAFCGNPQELIKSDILKNIYQTDVTQFFKNSYKKWI